jgi:bacterioferritin
VWREASARAVAARGLSAESRFRSARAVVRATTVVMKGDKQVIDVLNDVLTAELTAINQYFIHAKMMKNWGYERLAHKEHHESIDEMKHADMVIERILFLDGIPNLQRYNKVNVGETVPEQLRLDYEEEKRAVKRLNDGIKICRDLGDNGTKDLLERILVSEEEHIDWLESQLELIKQVGEQQYLAQQIKKDS